MPTASAAKLEKQGSLDQNDPLRQGIVMVDHKIRNLEKRKLKLDGYRDLQKNGKDLNSDQLEAISKYDAVIQHLDFAKELSKHLSSLALEAVKNAKKQARKEALEKAQQDLQRTKDLLMIQDVLSSMGQDNVREDFLQGKAKITLTAEELQHIDDLYIELTPKREEHINFQDMFQAPAEVLSSLLEGKNKEIAGTTYSALKTKLFDIAKSGYFDNAQPEPEPVVEEPIVVEEPPAVDVVPPVEAVVPPVVSNTFQPSAGLVNQIPSVAVPPPQTHVPLPQAPLVPVPPQTVVPVPVHQPPVVPPVVASVIPQPEEIRTPAGPIETTYFTPSHLRVFQSGTIDFMQDNELDTPDHIDATPSIPTMTYTNQSYTPTSQTYETPAQQPPKIAAPPQPEPQPIYHTVNNTQQAEDDGGWSHVGNDTAHHPPPPAPIEDNGGWEEEPSSTVVNAEDSWATQDSQWSQPQMNNDGFITQGGRGRGGRGGRGGGDRGDRNQKGGRGGGGGRGGRGGYNREGGYNRDGGYGGGGNYKDQNSYQNGYQNRSERGGRGRGGLSNDRQGGRGGRGGGGRGGGFRGGNQGGGYRQQQQQ